MLYTTQSLHEDLTACVTHTLRWHGWPPATDDSTWLVVTAIEDHLDDRVGGRAQPAALVNTLSGACARHHFSHYADLNVAGQTLMAITLAMRVERMLELMGL